jgi:hypothetical protein
VARVVLDARAIADLAHHLEVELGALLQPRRLQVAPLVVEPADPLVQLTLDLLDRDEHLLAWCHVVRGRIQVDLGPLGEDLARQLVDLDDPFHLVAEEVDPDDVLAVRRLDLQDVAAHAELRPPQCRVVALVLEVDEVAEDPVAAVVPAALELDDGRPIVHRRSQPVDRRDRCHDHDVPPLEERPRGVVPEPVDLLIA